MLLVTAALAALTVLGVLGYRSVSASAGSTASSAGASRESSESDHGPVGPTARPAAPDADGATGDEDDDPEVTNLDPDLLAALRLARTAAAAEGIDIEVTSGWRSPELQDRLLRDAVSTYGSEAEAARWVATAETSAHVSGDAIDVGPYDAILWLSQHGADYGLCQIYGNESWHYELRPDAVSQGCPPMYADPTEDPRMQR